MNYSPVKIEIQVILKFYVHLQNGNKARHFLYGMDDTVEKTGE